MSDDSGTHDPAEMAPPAEPGEAPVAKDLILFWVISVALTMLGFPINLITGIFLPLANNGCDPGGSPTVCNDHSFVLPLLMAALALTVVSYVIGGVLASVWPKARAKNVHWMFFVLSAVVYVAGYAAVWSAVHSG